MKILVDAPTGIQELIILGLGGSYFDQSCVLWEESIDGPMPEITLGGMVRSGATLVFSQERMDENIETLHDPQLVSAYLDRVREMREQLLNRLAGICAAAIVSGDMPTQQAFVTARQRLLDITKLSPVVIAFQARDMPALKAAVEQEYRAIVAAAPQTLIKAFNEVQS